MNDEIHQAIHSIPSRVIGHGNRAWTQAVKSAFIELGKKRGWCVCASSSEADVEPEWLYDLCWYARSDQEEFEIGLILESEWSNDYYDLRFDFEKLLCAKSPYKIFIFEAHEDTLDTKFSALQSAIRNCKLPVTDETYILAVYLPSRKTFEIRNIKLA